MCVYVHPERYPDDLFRAQIWITLPMSKSLNKRIDASQYFIKIIVLSIDDGLFSETHERPL
jgi:hypothetical protein